MDNLINCLLTLGVGGLVGVVFLLLKIPNGLRIGSLLGAALLGIFFGTAWMPNETRFAVQIIAGALVGCTMERSDLRRLPKIIKPTSIILGTFLALNLVAGSLIYAISPLNWATSLLCVVPGGVTEIPVIAADMGADPPKVAIAQLARYLLGVAFLPSIIMGHDNHRQKAKTGTIAPEVIAGTKTIKREKSTVNSVQAMICTIAVGLGAGFLGNFTAVPAGAFLFSMIGVTVLKLKFDFAYVSPRVKKIALWISGCYIGSLITMEDVKGFRLLVLPILIVLCGYIVNCFITGKLMVKTCGFTLKEGMLTTVPAGVTDIALTSVDMGVGNTDIIIIQVFRAMMAATIFPQIINLLLMVLPG